MTPQQEAATERKIEKHFRSHRELPNGRDFRFNREFDKDANDKFRSNFDKCFPNSPGKGF